MRTLIAALAAGVLVVGLTPAAVASDSPPSSGPDVISAILPSHPLRKSPQPLPLTRAIRPLDVSYEYDGRRYTLKEFLDRSAAWGFVVVDGESNEIVGDHYFASNPGTRFQSWSASKGFVGTAVGIAVDEGHIDSIDDPVTKYVPELGTSGYDGVSIRDVLRMSSGITWTEPLNIPPVHLGAAAGIPVTEFAKRRRRGWEPGSRFEYSGMNSFVLAWLIGKATGRPFYRYVEEKIWHPAGMASDAVISRDHHGNDLGYCCFMATVEDYSRLGLLYLNNGRAGGRQVVSESWVRESTRPSAPFNEPDFENDDTGYGLHWWLGGGSHGDYLASGFAGQKIYVSPRHGVVIAKSTLATVLTSDSEQLVAFRAIAAAVAASRG
ncbi:serine hydrolase domain-containing protein [Thermomonospora umbrina]|uniref:CubicO group peptidase (Beta-lactamase class C family) n=1 Tax=Thermomonospora umbrina TaxID=111806 RepID=A0A3D9SPV8_9ACTN|nr:serine hydrolase domain-containing protein [Thermomonospora umbrina]REE97992.1 CubicO group peptidase (beta-lactamase class C family) [Thermomonospora umbrina]